MRRLCGGLLLLLGLVGLTEAAESRWVYRLSNGQFLRGGFYAVTHDPATEGVVSLGERHPDPRTERFDPVTKTRPATAPEIAAYDAEQLDAQAVASVDTEKALKAIVVYMRTQLNVLRVAAGMSALTAAEVRAGIIQAYKALP